GFNFINDYSNENNTEALLTANRALTRRIRLNGMLGANTRHAQFTTATTRTAGISVAGIYNVSNAAIAPTLVQGVANRAANSRYGSAPVALNAVLANAELAPAITKSTGGGVGVGWWDGRVNIDATGYSRATRSQIFDVTIFPTAGLTNKSVHAGKISNKGFEALVTVIPI